MILNALILVAGVSFAAPVPKTAAPLPEEILRVKLATFRQAHVSEVRMALLGDAAELRDAVTASTGDEKKKLANRLPGMAQEPFDICRDLKGCEAAPQSLHVEDDHLIDDAFAALARPWFNLQKTRGKAVKVTVEPGVGVRLDLEDMPACASVTLEASPAPTGGFDVSLADAENAAPAYAAARSIVLSK